MGESLGQFKRDDNHVPITTDGLTNKKSHTFVGSGATVAVPLFHITGVVEIRGIWGIVTTALGVNHTDAHLRVNDQTATDQVLSKSTTLNLSGISAGAAIIKDGLAAAVLTYKTSDAGSILEPAVADQKNLSPVIIVQKTGDIQTDIEYVYTTSDTPTTGAMDFFVKWLPLSEDGKVESI